MGGPRVGAARGRQVSILDKSVVEDGVTCAVIEAFQNSADHGFWDGMEYREDRIKEIPGKLCLIHSEVSEALEAYRKSHPEKMIADVGEELADVCIRVFDLCGALHIDLGKAIVEKMAKNRARPRMHGKRC